MNNEDRIAIEGVFSRLQQVERQGGPRDPEAEQFIRSRIDAQPGAAYYLAQTVVVQEQALKAAQQRITELEQRTAAPASGNQEGFASGAARQSGLSAGYFGRTPPGGQEDGRQMSAAGTPLSAAGTPLQGGMPPGGSQFSQAAPQQQAPSRGGGFLAGAAQTAMGVAGGMMLGNLLGGLFGGGSHGANHLADSTPQIKDEPAADSQAASEQTSDPQFDPPNDTQDVAYDNSDDNFDGGGFFDDGGDYDEV